MPWFYQNDGDEIVGPISRETLQQLADDGEITPNTQVSESETAEPASTWVLAHSIAGLSFGPRRPRQKPETPRNQPGHSGRNPPRRRSVPVSGVTVTIFILGAALAAIGGLSFLLRTMMVFEGRGGMTDQLRIFVLEIAGSFMLWGLLLLLIAVMWENVRATRAVFWVLKDQYDVTHPEEAPAPPNVAPLAAQQPVVRHPLD